MSSRKAETVDVLDEVHGVQCRENPTIVCRIATEGRLALPLQFVRA